MITFPNIKINLGLSITEKRPDGYHNLETVFYPVALEDALEIRTNPEAQQKFTLHQHGMEIAGNPENNLVVKALFVIRQKNFTCLLSRFICTNISLQEPDWGGGSSDAAFMLKLLNEHYNLQLSDNQLEDYAATLGADCAFFIKKTHRLTPKVSGNIFSPIELSLKGYRIMIVKPDVFVSTREAFANIRPPPSRISGQRGYPSSGRRVERYINQ